MSRWLPLFFLILLHLELECRLISYKTIPEFMEQYPKTKWIKCTQDYAFDYPEFPLYKQFKEKRFPNQGLHSDISILEIPDAQAFVHSDGYVFLNNVYLKESQIKNFPFKDKNSIQAPDPLALLQVKGRVAVINHLYSWVYALFILDVLLTLSLLEIYQIEYDYVWIPYHQSFMKEALEIWGIDKSKIISLYPGYTLQADTIIFPTSISQNPEPILNANYYPDFLLKYFKNKMVSSALKYNVTKEFPEKIFISRKDANNRRVIPNEDEVFALFEPLGYKRLEFSKLSMLEKIVATNRAKSIINFIGSASTNILFASSDTKFYDIHQEMVEATFYFIACSIGCHYEILDVSALADLLYGMPFSQGRAIPINLVKKFITDHPDL